MNLASRIVKQLRAAGLEAYLPGVHEGICLSPYCVARLFSGSLSTPRGGYARYRVHLYVPAISPEQLEPLAEAVREALAPMESDGSLRLAEPRGMTGVDDAYRAACSYIDYVSYYSER